MPNVSPLSGSTRRRLPCLFLLAVALSSVVRAEPVASPVSNTAPSDPATVAAPVLIANPLRRPRVREVHITYHQKNFYYCEASMNAGFARADAC